MASLSQKLDKAKDEHAAEQLDQMQTHHNQAAAEEAIFILGRIKQNDHIGNAIATNLTAQTMLALERFQQEKKHEALGYATFDKFLDESRYSPMKKTQYYDRKKILLDQGPEVFDLLTSVGISMRAQKLLTDGDIAIKNDRLYVGEKEVSLENAGVIKEVLDNFFEEKRDLQKKLDKAAKKIEAQTHTIDQGREEIEDLNRRLDANSEESPYAGALMRVHNAMTRLAAEARKLPSGERRERGDQEMPSLVQHLMAVADGFGVPFNRYERQAATESAGDDEMGSIIDRAIAESDDEGLD